ncbi:MAG: DegV family EDD domain-containing protein [Gammaproteobacteria bacterium]|nr:DegV family EDD domain-containing protein [Gammaproteobacteria bacterium]
MASPAEQQLGGNEFASALVSGIHRVIADQEFLNRINVFPVADGDTGTNLSLSLGAALALLERPGERHLGTLLASIADTLLDGARGNSGAIVAQFFQGVSDAAAASSCFTPATFSEAVRQGSDYARDALSNPQEGTILSVISAFAAALATAVAARNDTDFAALLNAALPPLERSLAGTTGQLDVLRKAGVVDAGAKGFVDLIKGMSEFILHGRIDEKPDLSMLQLSTGSAATVVADGNYAFRFCTECVITGTNIDRRKLREALADVGDSLVLAGTKRKAKIHVHVNDPQEVFDIGREFGDISAEKADDLQRQQHSSHDVTRRFAVITDSAADIADEDMERLDIHMVPCRIQFGDRGYLDKVSITAEEFFTELASNPHHPTTSQPAPGDFRRQFQFLASHYADVISINLTGAASGTIEAARSAAGRIDAPGRVHVINSLNASLGEGLLAVLAAECAAAGLSVESTIEAVTALIPQTRSYGVLSDLRYAVRGGRLPRWVKTIADLLHVTPIIRTTPDGRIALSGFFFGKQKRAERLAQHVARKVRAAGPISIAIGHAICADEAATIAVTLREKLPDIERLTIAELGAAIGVHGGPGTLVVATQPFTAPAAISA